MADLPCPCGKSSDAYSIDPRGWGHCFSCGDNFPPEVANDKITREDDDLSERGEVPKNYKELTPLTDVYRDLKERGIPAAAVKKFQINVNAGPGDWMAKYPIFKDGKHVGNKVRRKGDKSQNVKEKLAPFWMEGNPDEFNNAELLGQHLFEPGSAKAITIVEGQDDMAAGWVLLGSRYPVVSVLGSGSALRDVRNNFEYLNSFPEIVIAFDTDKAKVNPKTGELRYPGQEAAKKVAELFTPGKCRILTMKKWKDPNDYLKAGMAKEFVEEWWKAPKFMPDGLKLGPDMWDSIVNRPKHFQVDYPFAGLNRLTYGIRLSEFVTLTAETGIGKTSILKHIEYALLMNPELQEKGYGVGFIHLEEPNYDTALGLLSIHNRKPYHLPDTERTVDELRTAYDAVLNNSRVVIWDHFGSNSVDAILDKVRHMAALGCKYIVLDHLSIVVSDQSGDERKQLDEISTKLKTLCMNLNVALICVIHQNRQGQIRGTAGVEQLSNIVMKLYRDNTDPDPWRRNVTKIVIEKNRFCGRTGPGCYLWYNEITGCLEELDEDGVNRYESGGTLRDDERAF